MPSKLLPTDRVCIRCKSAPAVIYASQPHLYWCVECRKRKIQEYHKKVMETKPEQERERKRLWARAHPENGRKSNRRWREANPGRMAEITQNYRDRRFFMNAANTLKQFTGVRLSPLELWGLWKKQRGICSLTGRKLDGRLRGNASLDHIIARSLGGCTKSSNLRWVCLEANFAKHKLSDEQFVTLCSDVVNHMNNGGKSNVRYA